MKNIKITKKQWYLKNIKTYFEEYIRHEHDYEYEDVDDEDLLETFLQYENHDKELIDYIKSDLNDLISDDLTCVNGIGGKQDEQIGMIEFINMFSDLNFKIKDFEIDKDNQDYHFKTKFKKYNYKYEFLSDFFRDFIDKNAEKILNEVENGN